MCMQGALSVGRGHGDNVHLTERQNISRIDGLPIARGLKGSASGARRRATLPRTDRAACQPRRLPT
jgi:hypothetical protein